MTTLFRHALFLALRYLAAAPWRTAILVLGVTTALFLPAFTYLGSRLVERSLLQRATSTPLVIGFKGNEFDLAMSSLYFRGSVQDPVSYGTRRLITERDYGLAVPIYTQHSAGGVPIVGTSLDYFEVRGLEIADGRSLAMLGEVVAGAAVAERQGWEVGSKLRSDLTNLYNIAGAYPKILEVVGILAPTGGPDDEALFADVKTTWMLDGRFHGHDEITPDDALNPEAGEGEVLEATAAIFIFNEITPRNRGSFHMHGDEDDAPISSVLVFPRNRRAHDQILGDFALEETLQAVSPESVVRTILGIVLRVQEGLFVYFVLVAGSTLSFFVLIVVLSLRLREREIDLMKRIGCSRHAVATIIGVEVSIIVAAALVASVLLTAAGLAILSNTLPA